MIAEVVPQTDASSAGQWIPVQMRTPPSLRTVLVYVATLQSICVAVYDNGGWYRSRDFSPILAYVTHWQPLPERPVDGNNQ